MPDLVLTHEQASHLARLALECVGREYPSKLDHVMNDASEVKSPRALHPVFYGCFDWHSAVHGHWLLVRLLRRLPDLQESGNMRRALDGNLTADNVRAEVQYLKQTGRQSFERPYGWAWLLKLAEELNGWDDPDGARWAVILEPLADTFARMLVEFLPKQTYPNRTGVHSNTAFALGFALDYARAVSDKAIEALVTERSLAYFKNDVRYPAGWEPGGEDFFSPALEEADLMRRILPQREFVAWLHRFLPELAEDGPRALLDPAIVSDRTDPKLVHLDGLNLSRAWCMLGVAEALPVDDPARPPLVRAVRRHATAGLSNVASGAYVGEHWLGTFAVYLLTQAT